MYPCETMNKIMKFLLSCCWSNGYLVIGICVGLSLSLLFAPVEIDPCSDATDSMPHASGFPEIPDEYEPKINLAGKPLRAQKAPKVLTRPRYYSTELGIREKLFVGILTSQEYLHSRGVAQNKTIAHLVDKVRYFILIPEAAKPNVSLPGIVGFTDTSTILKPFHVLKYITDNYLEDYDFYFIMKDVSYVNARRLVQMVEKISVSRDVHLGATGELDVYCSLDAGVLLSNSVVRLMKTNLDWCVKNTLSDSDDTNFGRCILHSTSIPCSSGIQGQNLLATRLKPTFNFETDLLGLTKKEDFENAIIVYPISDHSVLYKMNAYFARNQLAQVQAEISTLRRQILKTARLGPEDKREVTWPVGNQPGNRAPGRFDVLRWTYFNETHTFLETDFEISRELKGSARMDVEYVVNATAERIQDSYEGQLRFRKLVNGYRKYDGSRGMDYILDMMFTDVRSGQDVLKRIEVCKPLGKVEILPVPYVTENSRINLILVVNTFQKNDALAFMSHYAQACMEKKDRTFLIVVLLYDPNSPSKAKNDIFHDVKQYALFLTGKYKKDESTVAWLSMRLPETINTIELEPMLKIAVADLVVKKFSLDSLILFTETRVELRTEYLNRVRMNTISHWQVFSPIPFVEFHPDIAYADPNVKHVEMDVARNYGRYDELNYNHVSFHVRDYIAARKAAEVEIPPVRSDRDISIALKMSQQNVVTSIFELFVKFSELHPLRAVEPSLKIRHKEMNCGGTKSDAVYKTCAKERSLNLGIRGQLAKLILDYQNVHSVPGA